MNSLQVFDYNGQSIHRRQDGYLSLTQMCNANGKRVNDFLRLSATKSYIDELSATTGIPAFELVEVKEGQHGGTWGHPLLALRCAQWISPKFAVWCDAHIFNLMETGITTLDYGDRQTEIKALPQRDTIDYVQAAAILPTLKVNGLLKQLLEDALTDDLELMRNQKALPGAKRQFTIVKVRAKELGYSTERIGNGGSLGRFVAQIIHPAMSERVGKFMVNHYEVTPELDEAIHAYFR